MWSYPLMHIWHEFFANKKDITASKSAVACGKNQKHV